jgi:hypothetical protein
MLVIVLTRGLGDGTETALAGVHGIFFLVGTNKECDKEDCNSATVQEIQPDMEGGGSPPYHCLWFYV